jgi:hypothetical protein
MGHGICFVLFVCLFVVPYVRPRIRLPTSVLYSLFNAIQSFGIKQSQLLRLKLNYKMIPSASLRHIDKKFPKTNKQTNKLCAFYPASEL